jgi:hypothetical protein
MRVLVMRTAGSQRPRGESFAGKPRSNKIKTVASLRQECAVSLERGSPAKLTAWSRRLPSVGS